MKIEDLIACQYCAGVFLKSSLNEAGGRYNDYTCPSYICPQCDQDILDYEVDL